MQANYRNIYSKNSGFTLLEMAIVTFISGLIVVALLNVYKIHVERKFLTETRDKQYIIDSAISSYKNREGVGSGTLPCPADPSLPISHPNSGVASCTLYDNFLAGTASIGDCTNGTEGICLVAGIRDTDADTDTAPDPILIGAVPYKTIGLVLTDTGGDGLGSENLDNDDTDDIVTSGGVADEVGLEMSLDPWGYKMTYAVSAYMTDANKFENNIGAINIRTELGTNIVDPPGSAHYVIVGYGNNHAGAYSAEGRIPTPCVIGVAESENCDGDGEFVKGLRTLKTGVEYYDDTVFYKAFAMSMLWAFVPQKEDIINLNIGNVGIGITSPKEKLHIVGGAVKADKASQKELCDKMGSNCWDPNNIAGIDGTKCPPAPAGKISVVKSIKAGEVVCVEVPAIKANTAQYCPAGQYVTGFDILGNIICKVF